MLVVITEKQFNAMDDASYTVTHYPALSYIVEELHCLESSPRAWRVQVTRVGDAGSDGKGKYAGYWRLVTSWAAGWDKL